MNFELLSYRQVLDRDQDFFYELKKSSIKPWVEPFWGWEEKVQRDFIKNEWSSLELEIIVYDTEDIGSIELNWSDEYVRLGEFFLMPEYRRKGIGTFLISNILEQANEKNLHVKLEVIKGNPARNLYLRSGFLVTGESETHFLMQRTPGNHSN